MCTVCLKLSGAVLLFVQNLITASSVNTFFRIMKYDTNVKSWSVIPSIVLPGASVNSQCILLPGNPNAGPPAIPDKILIFINTDQYTTSAAATIFNTGTSAFETVTNADNLNSLAGACAINLKVAAGPVML